MSAKRDGLAANADFHELLDLIQQAIDETPKKPQDAEEVMGQGYERGWLIPRVVEQELSKLTGRQRNYAENVVTTLRYWQKNWISPVLKWVVQRGRIDLFTSGLLPADHSALSQDPERYMSQSPAYPLLFMARDKTILGERAASVPVWRDSETMGEFDRRFYAEFFAALLSPVLCFRGNRFVESCSTIRGALYWLRDEVKAELAGLTALPTQAALPNQEQLSVVNDEAMLSPAALAKHFGVPLPPLKKRLERLRKTDHNCFVELAERGSQEPGFLYRVKNVLPIVENLKARASRETSRKRPTGKK